jgi:hypothetical protein
MTMAACWIIERINVIRYLGLCKLSSSVDLLLDAFFLRLLKNDSATALSQQFPRRLMLGSR